MKKNPLEWLVFAVSLVLVVAVIGYLAAAIVRAEGGKADIRVTTGAPEASRDEWRVPLVVRNDGDETAEAVRIEVTLQCGQARERAELDFAFVPRHSQREGAVQFRNDPRACTLAARTMSYEEP